MPTREIPRTEWKSYFDEFSRTRAGEKVTVEMIYNPQGDRQYAMESQPLVGMTFEEKGSEAGSIAIMVGGATDDSLTHTVTHPIHVYHKNAAGFLSEEVNPDEVLELTSSDDPRITYLRFERPD